MVTVLMVVQVILSVLLSLAILLQQSGSGLSATFGGGGASFQATRRGPEKFLHIATIVLAVLFLLNSIVFLFV